MRKFRYNFTVAFIVWLMIVFFIGLFLNFTFFVKWFGKSYISLCDDLQTEVIKLLYEKVDIKPVSSLIKTSNGIVWKQTTFELQVPYDIKISYIINELKRKFEFNFKLLKEEKGYKKYLVSYNKLPIQILDIYLKIPKVAVIFDDVGENIELVKEISKLNIPVTVSVLPFLLYSKKSAVLARENNIEVMLHLPMEPHDSDVPPGIHAITTEMPDDEIIKWTRESIQNIPYIRGINNHMGSKATEDKRVMRAVLGVAKYYNLYFVDSRTSSKSVVLKIAKEMEIPIGLNQWYLDNKNNIEYIKDRLEQLIKIVLDKGEVIAIGHFRYKTIKAFKDYIAKFKDNGIDFVYVSEIVK